MKSDHCKKFDLSYYGQVISSFKDERRTWVGILILGCDTSILNFFYSDASIFLTLDTVTIEIICLVYSNSNFYAGWVGKLSL